MPKAPKPPDRETLLGKIAKYESKLAQAPKDGTTAEASIDHASLQIAYWRTRQVVASLDIREATAAIKALQETKSDTDSAVALLRLAILEARKCTEMAAEWERRKSDSAKLIIGRELRALEERFERDQAKDSGFTKIETD